jgi:hypothetical protein
MPDESPHYNPEYYDQEGPFNPSPPLRPVEVSWQLRTPTPTPADNGSSGQYPEVESQDLFSDWSRIYREQSPSQFPAWEVSPPPEHSSTAAMDAVTTSMNTLSVSSPSLPQSSYPQYYSEQYASGQYAGSQPYGSQLSWAPSYAAGDPGESSSNYPDTGWSALYRQSPSQLPEREPSPAPAQSPTASRSNEQADPQVGSSNVAKPPKYRRYDTKWVDPRQPGSDCIAYSSNFPGGQKLFERVGQQKNSKYPAYSSEAAPSRSRHYNYFYIDKNNVLTDCHIKELERSPKADDPHPLTTLGADWVLPIGGEGLKIVYRDPRVGRKAVSDEHLFEKTLRIGGSHDLVFSKHQRKRFSEIKVFYSLNDKGEFKLAKGKPVEHVPDGVDVMAEALERLAPPAQQGSTPTAYQQQGDIPQGQYDNVTQFGYNTATGSTTQSAAAHGGFPSLAPPVATLPQLISTQPAYVVSAYPYPAPSVYDRQQAYYNEQQAQAESQSARRQRTDSDRSSEDGPDEKGKGHEKKRHRSGYGRSSHGG